MTAEELYNKRAVGQGYALIKEEAIEFAEAYAKQENEALQKKVKELLQRIVDLNDWDELDMVESDIIKFLNKH